MTTSVRAPRRPHFWETYAPGTPYAARDLRALRDGLGREPGSVPAMRPLHRTPLPDIARPGEPVPAAYAAEHATLTLFGFHQPPSRPSVHQAGAGLGTACRRLHRTGAMSGKALDRRVTAAATAQDLDELLWHLRGLVPLLRDAGIGLDYTRLLHDLRSWLGTGHGRTIRAWGLQYTDRAGTQTSSPNGGPATAIPDGEGSPYWVTFDPQRAETGAELAALRSGLGREAGTVPAMWPFHRARVSPAAQEAGFLGRGLAAEHAVLTLFGLHQQARREPMHAAGTSPGAACRRLLHLVGADKAGEEAMTRRVGQLLTSADGEELCWHLRGLVPLLRGAAIGLDYTRLRDDLLRWDDARHPEQQARIRSRWDRDFRIGAPTGQG
ncbi:type I-E CRISPR-associated protein Cse2/CasB [Streptomyces sp. NBC_00510]